MTIHYPPAAYRRGAPSHACPSVNMYISVCFNLDFVKSLKGELPHLFFAAPGGPSSKTAQGRLPSCALYWTYDFARPAPRLGVSYSARKVDRTWG